MEWFDLPSGAWTQSHHFHDEWTKETQEAPDSWLPRIPSQWGGGWGGPERCQRWSSEDCSAHPEEHEPGDHCSATGEMWDIYSTLSYWTL